MKSKTKSETRECPFPDCDWEYEYRPDYSGETSADYQSELHYEREHAGRVRIQVTLEAEQLLGGRDPDDIRESYLERDDYRPFEVAHVATEVFEPADDHSDLQTKGEE